MEETIGEKLRHARLLKGYTLDDVQQMTKIQKRYIMAIEENQFDLLPGDFYIRAFIKQIAETVGLNGQQILLDYDLIAPSIPKVEPVEYPQINTTRKKLAAKNDTSFTRAFYALKGYAPTLLLGALVVAIFFAIGKAVLDSNKGKKPATSVASSSVVLETTSSSSSTEESSSVESSSSSQAAKVQVTQTGMDYDVIYYTAVVGKNPLTIQIKNKSVDPLWTSVAEDQEVLTDQIIPSKGQAEAVVSADAASVTMQFGYTPDGEITLNGQALEIPKNTEAKVIYIRLQ